MSDLAGAYTEEVVQPTPDSEFADFVRAIESEFDRISSDADAAIADHTIDSVDGDALDRYVKLVGVERRDGESDDQLRRRAMMRGGATLSSGTTNELMRLTAFGFEVAVDDSGLSFPIDLSSDPGVFQVEVDSQIASDAALSSSTVESELEEAQVAGHRVSVTEV